jgi:hypothetical protein
MKGSYADILILLDPAPPEPWQGHVYYLPDRDMYYMELLKRACPKTDTPYRIVGFRYIDTYGEHVWPDAIDIIGENGALIDAFSDPDTLPPAPHEPTWMITTR